MNFKEADELQRRGGRRWQEDPDVLNLEKNRSSIGRILNPSKWDDLFLRRFLTHGVMIDRVDQEGYPTCPPMDAENIQNLHLQLLRFPLPHSREYDER